MWTPRAAASLVMFTLLLLRAGAGPVMAQCTPEHHTEQAETAHHEDHGRGMDAPSPTTPPGCDHQSHEGQGHTQLDCDLAAGCAASPSAIASGQFLSLAGAHGAAETTFEAQPHLRAVLPASPPPKS
ncbi:MAG: hypothetical protein ABR551_09140 [Gemmatimonadales bacterium]